RFPTRHATKLAAKMRELTASSDYYNVLPIMLTFGRYKTAAHLLLPLRDGRWRIRVSSGMPKSLLFIHPLESTPCNSRVVCSPLWPSGRSHLCFPQPTPHAVRQ